MLTKVQALAWVADPARSDDELRRACVALGIPHAGTRAELITRLDTKLNTIATAGDSSGIDPAHLPAIPPAPRTPVPARAQLARQIALAGGVGLIVLLLVLFSFFVGQAGTRVVVQTRIVERTVVSQETVVVPQTVIAQQTVIVPATSAPAPAATDRPAPTNAPVQPTNVPVPTSAPRVNVVDFPKNPAEVIDLFNIRGIHESDVTTCPNEGGKCFEIKVSPFTMDNPWSCWLDSYRENAGQRRSGDYMNNARSGVPPNSHDTIIDSGVTIRECSAYAAAPTPGALGLDQSIGATIPGFPDTARAAAKTFGIDLNTAIVWACGENHCFDWKPRSPNKFFNVSNTSGCWQDGYRWVADPSHIRPGYTNETDAAKISVWSGFSGPVEEIVIRPCSGATSATPVAVATSASAPSAGSMDFMTKFVLTNTIVTPCDGESNCSKVKPATGQFFHIVNNSGCWQDGYTRVAHELRPGQSDPKTSIPAGYNGDAEAATLRPCQ